MNNLANYIDHTFLKKNAKEEEIERVCDEAIKYGFKGVCVFPEFIKIVSKKLKNQKILPISVVDFPLGDKSPKEKASQAKKAIDDGAKEIDMVMDVLYLKDKKYDLVLDGIKAVTQTAKNIPVKVIIETCYLTPCEIAIACSLAELAKAKFVKTSTGFGKDGAKIEDIFVMKNSVSDDMQVKASGGIKTYNDAKMMIEAGATRLGTSSSVQIMNEDIKE